MPRGAIGHRGDLAQQLLDKERMRLGLNLAGLQHDGAVLQGDVALYSFENLRLIELVALEDAVVAAYAAVEAVLGADVAHLDDAAQTHHPAYVAHLHLVGGGIDFALSAGVALCQQQGELVACQGMGLAHCPCQNFRNPTHAPLSMIPPPSSTSP
jgi:hypothetical protein